MARTPAEAATIIITFKKERIIVLMKQKLQLETYWARAASLARRSFLFMTYSNLLPGVPFLLNKTTR